MASKRLASITPEANTVTRLTQSDVTAVASIIVSNKFTTPAEVTIYVRPVEDIGTESRFSYVAANLPITAGQVFETFRFAIAVGDIVEVIATTDSINFTITAVYDNQGGAQVRYVGTQPPFPSVGDIWVSSDDSSVSLWTGSEWNAIALNAPAGPQGPTGPAGNAGPQGTVSAPFSLQGTVASTSSLPASGSLGSIDEETGATTFPDAYYVADEGVIYSWTLTGWKNVGPIIGPTGPRTTSVFIVGAVSSVINLPESGEGLVPVGEDGNATFYVTSEDVLYSWNGSGWVNIGRVQGPQGPTGPQGEQGIQGTQGFNFTVLGTVNNVIDLNSLTPASNDAYFVLGVGDDEAELEDLRSGIFIWAGTSWELLNNFAGPAGPAGDAGTPGEPGLSAYQVAVQEGFSEGEEEWLLSLVGPNGPAAVSFTVLGRVALISNLPVSGNTLEDTYYVDETSSLHTWTGLEWVDVGPISGPAGADGAVGADGADGPTGPAGPTGPVGISWQGEWNAAAQYAENDGVSYLGSSYIATALLPVVGTVPAGSLDWDVIAEAGAGGSTVAVAATVDTTTFVGLYEDATGTIGGKTNSGITYDATSQTLTVTAVETGSLQAPANLTGTYSIVSPTTITLNATDEILNSAPIRLVNKTSSQLSTLVSSVGSVVWNSTDSVVSVYNGSTWVPQAGAAGVDGTDGASGTDGLTVTDNFQVTANGTSAYIIDGASNPTLTLVRGRTYFFTVNASGHPFYIKTAAVTGTGSAYNTGVTGNGTQVGGIQFTVDASAPSTLYYICQFHSAMVGTINVIG